MLGQAAPLGHQLRWSLVFRFCLLVPPPILSLARPSSLTLPPSHDPPLEPGDVDGNPSPDLDLNLRAELGPLPWGRGGARAPRRALLWGWGLLGSLIGALGGKGDTPLPLGGSFMVSLLVPPSRAVGDQASLPLHGEGLLPRTPWPRAAFCTSRTLLRVFEALPGAPSASCQCPSPVSLLGSMPSPPKGLGLLGPQGPQHQSPHHS
uniref:Uncharacterized protein n=1 Tax=Pipistrellus kuhlii TaxID=59472 RepID=A0A7J7Y9I1_PIPKU|nr:hypothetical protein mPipKuh1_010315 [Pipistrellus kuhlii]